MKTGTANYLKLLVRDLISIGITDIAIVYDKTGFEDFKLVPDVDFLREILIGDKNANIDLIENHQFNEEWDQTVVYFTANNHYHFYVYDLLLRPKRAKRFVVIHEPSCMMAATSYFEWDRICSRHDYIEHLEAQFGRAARQLRDDIKAGKITESLQYEIIGFDYKKFQPDIIFVHSRFARLKLIMELDNYENIPIKVAHHPVEDAVDHLKYPLSEGGVIFGIFGFVNPAKRVYEVMDGFKKFLDEITHYKSKKDYRLLIVGQLPPAFYYSPKNYAKKIGIFQNCEFYGYVDKKKFNELYFSCAVVFNLRFPSCGETTGLAGYGVSGPKLVMSDYHAFRELPADNLVDLDNEISDIKNIMLNQINNFEKNKNSTDLKDERSTETVGYAIGLEFAKND
jgi:glycosyltransferase involved in cell wall biosynthesis